MKKILLAANILFSLVVAGQQVPKALTASNGVYIGFYEYKPTNYNPNLNPKYPLIIFLHGIGERGNGTNELSRVLQVNIPRMIEYGQTMTFTWNGKTETFLVLSPQLSTNYGDWQNFYVQEMINYAKQNLNVDPDRIFLTGLSLGGGGTWGFPFYSLSNAQQLAGIAPICGTCQWNGNWGNIANAKLPVWAFHAQDDGIVGVGCTTGAIQNINNLNPVVKPYMTIWPDGNHFVWDRAYNTAYDWQNPNLFEWFLAQNKSLPANVRPVANAGADVSVSTNPGSVTLNAYSSYDPDGSIVRYIWRKISGPSFGTINNPTSGSPTITGLSLAGTYQYEVKAVDNRADWTTDIVSVTVTNGGPANQAPTANAGSDISITLPTSNATLNGGASYDADGSIVSYSWSKISGPSSYTLGTPNANTSALSNLTQGTYVFRLTVTDNSGATGSDDVSVTVNPAPAPSNLPPTANAGSDISITLPASNATLNGGASYDADGSIVSYSWSKISGPSSHTLGTPNANTSTVSNLTQGTYVFRLTVTDNSGAAASDDVSIVVNPAPAANQLPVANAGNDATITLPSNSFTLDGSASDPDGYIVSYGWTKVSGPGFTVVWGNGSTAGMGITNLTQGTYVFRLLVTDNSGGTDTDTIVVTVNSQVQPTNIPPVANAGNAVSITLPTNNVTVNGSGSYDPDGTILAYQWLKLSGPAQYNIVNASAASTSINNLTQGKYYFILKVWDNNWEPREDTVEIDVTGVALLLPPNQPPVAKAGNDVTLTLPANSTTLNGTSSFDPDGSIIAYHWTKIGGPSQYLIANSGAATTNVTNLVQGTYLFNLRVYDNKWEPRDDTVVVTVNSSTPVAGNQPPVANAGPDKTITLPTNAVTVNSTSYDPDGSIIAYQWRKINGPSQFLIANAAASATSITNLQQGNYSFCLTVWDNNWEPRADTIVINVNGSAGTGQNQKPVARAGADVTITLPTNSVTVNGSSSYDPDGSLIAYHWTKLSGPSQYTIANAGGVQTTISNLVQGTYAFNFRVYDNNWEPHDDTLIVVVKTSGGGTANASQNNVMEASASSTVTAANNLKVYPNPAVNVLNISLTNNTMGTSIINIYDVAGKMVRTTNVQKGAALLQQTINVNGLVPGTYMLEIITDKKTKQIIKFIKQ